MPPATRRAAGTYSTDVFVQAVDRIISNRAPDKPTFVYMPFQSVHGPLEAPQRFIDMYPASMDAARRKYAGMVSALDAAVGEIEQIYIRAGIWDQTITVFTTDNGGPLGSANNWPLRGHKATAWEGGVRGIAFVRGTADTSLFPVPAGTTTMELMHSTDWYPTLGAVAGYATFTDANVPLDGVDQWGVIARGENTTRTSIIHNSPGADDPLTGGAIRVGRFKLLVRAERMQVKGNMPQTVPPGFAPGGVGSESLVCPPPEPVNNMWLFDVIADPRECHNLAGSHPDVVARLQAAMKNYKATAVGDLALTHGQSDNACNPSHLKDRAWGPWAYKSSKCQWV